MDGPPQEFGETRDGIAAGVGTPASGATTVGVTTT